MRRKRGRADWWILLAAVVVLVSGGTVGAQLEQLRKSRSAIDSTEGQPAPMIVIPEGAFAMGRDGTEALEDERPQHRVWVDRFSIDQYEVTAGHYAAFLHETSLPAPEFWEMVMLSKHGEKPVVGVSWEEAHRFCEWAGKRLPTEAEWEKAARGTDGRRYPWGDRPPTSELANFALGARFSYDQVLLPVGHFPEGASPYGVQDLAGNVWEWVQDWYHGSYYEMSPPRNPLGPETGQFKVLRGGSWSDLPKYLLTYSRFKLPPGTRNSFTGFRCAKSVP